MIRLFWIGLNKIIDHVYVFNSFSLKFNGDDDTLIFKNTLMILLMTMEMFYKSILLFMGLDLRKKHMNPISILPFIINDITINN